MKNEEMGIKTVEKSDANYKVLANQLLYLVFPIEKSRWDNY
jgi:hypothetical protein